MSGKFALRKDAAGGFRFNLVASIGEVIASSESYVRKDFVLGGIDSVRRNAADAVVDDQTVE
jgi:uncharacterized protein YegP (UPF0339 family)